MKGVHSVLYLCSSEGPVSAEPRNNMFFHLSRYLSGSVLASVPWHKNPESLKRVMEFQSAMGDFTYYGVYKSRLPSYLGKIRLLVAYVYRGLRLYYGGCKYEVVVVYGLSAVTVAGYILKVLTGRKLVVMVVIGLKAFYSDNYAAKSSILKKLANRAKECVAVLLLKGADRLYLVGSKVLDGYGVKETKPRSCFFDFARIGSIEPARVSSDYILSLGGPWHRKGIDVLIRAFMLISGEFPKCRLKIVGADPDRQCMDLTGGLERIEFLPFCSHEEAMQFLSGCGVYVQASRNEGMARVVMEAMAARKPIIASNVGGTSDMITDGRTGLLFESENINELADKMRIVLRDNAYASELAEAAHQYASRHFSGDNYAQLFTKMIDATLHHSAFSSSGKEKDCPL